VHPLALCSGRNTAFAGKRAPTGSVSGSRIRECPEVPVGVSLLTMGPICSPERRLTVGTRVLCSTQSWQRHESLVGARLPAIWRAAAAESDDGGCQADRIARIHDDCVADRGTSHAPTGSASSFREQARPVRCLARDHGLPQCPCGSELAHDGARTSAALSVAGMQSSRLAPTGFVCGHRMSRRRFSGGSELAHDGADMFAGETPDSRSSSFVLDTVLATPRIPCRSVACPRSGAQRQQNRMTRYIRQTA